ELFSLSRSLDLLKVWAHPFRFVGRDHTRSLTGILDESLVDGFDAIDLNAKDLFLHGIEMIDLVLDTADERGLPVIGGSDAHHPSQIGSVYNECDGSITSYAALRDAIISGSLTPRHSEQLREKVEAAERYKATVLEKAGFIP
ncbi:MAG: PHP-associated domain-containing protein, partial [Alkalispirochaeta sp.]